MLPPELPDPLVPEPLLLEPLLLEPDWLPRVPPEVVVDAPPPERCVPVETLTSVDCRVVPLRSTETPVSSRVVLRPGTVVVSSTEVLERPLERTAVVRGLRFVETFRAALVRLTVRRTSVAGSSDTVVRRRVVTLGSSEVSVRRRTDTPLSRDSEPTPTFTPERPDEPPLWVDEPPPLCVLMEPPDWPEPLPPVVVVVLDCA
jgi:hypothetical protein